MAEMREPISQIGYQVNPGYFYTDPSGTSWWVGAGMTPGQSLGYWSDKFGGISLEGLSTQPEPYTPEMLQNAGAGFSAEGMSGQAYMKPSGGAGDVDGGVRRDADGNVVNDMLGGAGAAPDGAVVAKPGRMVDAYQRPGGPVVNNMVNNQQVNNTPVNSDPRLNNPATLQQAAEWDRLNGPAAAHLNPYRRMDVVTPENARGQVLTPQQVRDEQLRQNPQPVGPSPLQRVQVGSLSDGGETPDVGNGAQPAGRLTLRGPDGQTIVVTAYNTPESQQQIDQYTRNGYVPLNAAGQPFEVFDFEGGQVFVDPATKQPSTLASLVGGPGQLSPESKARMQSPEFQQMLAAAQAKIAQRPPDNGSPYPGNPQPGGPGGGPGGLPGPLGPNNPLGPDVGFNGGDMQNMVTQLINNVYSRIPGAEQLFGNAAQFSSNLMAMLTQDRALRDQVMPMLMQPDAFEQGLRNMIGENAGKRDKFVNDIMGDTKDEDAIRFGIGRNVGLQDRFVNEIMGNRDIENRLPGMLKQRDDMVKSALGPAQDEIARVIGERDRGLSDAAKAALYGTAKENVTRGFGNAAQELKALLGQSGAMGGEMPGAEGDIVRSFAPLLAERERAVSEGERNTILADEAQKNQSRQSALNAAGMSGSLVNSLGGIYDPSSILSILNNAANVRNQGAIGMANAFSPDALVNALNQAKSNRYSGAQGMGNLYDPTKFIGGANAAAGNRNQMAQIMSEMFSGGNLISGINNSLGNQSGAFRNITDLLGLPFQGVNSLANIAASKEGTDWAKLITTAVLSGAMGAKGQDGKSIWDTIFGKLVDLIPGGNKQPDVLPGGLPAVGSWWSGNTPDNQMNKIAGIEPWKPSNSGLQYGGGQNKVL